MLACKRTRFARAQTTSVIASIRKQIKGENVVVTTIPVDNLIVEETRGSLGGDPLTQLERREDEADRLWRINLNIDGDHDTFIADFVKTQYFGEHS